MPHATEHDAPDSDDADFQNVMRQINAPFGEGGLDFDFLSRDLEPGEKAEDAVDYEDISDEDLPEEEEPSARPPGEDVMDTTTQEKEELQEMEDVFGEEDGGERADGADGADGDELDDLFGDVPSSPAADQEDQTRDLFFEDEEPPVPDGPVEEPAAEAQEAEAEAEEDAALEDKRSVSPAEEEEEEDMDPATLRAWKLQQALFAMHAPGPDNPPAPPENIEELLHSLWPKFDRNALPRFLELIPHKKAYFVGKQPLKPPKPVQPTKINLELAPDQERAFKAGGQANKRALESEQLGIVPIAGVSEEEDSLEEDFGADTDPNEVFPGGVTMQDLRVICADWDIKSQTSEMEVDEEFENAKAMEQSADDDDWLFETTRPAKKRKLGRDPKEIIALSHIDLPIFDDPEQVTARIAKKVTIDMNDPHLLLDELRPDSMVQKPKTLGAIKRDEMDANVTKRLTQRYNISNDEAYDMLKENHQNKVRSTLGGISLEHSMPALRLQWPYYKTELSTSEKRSFHRPALSFRPGQSCWFKNPAYIKRKHQKGKDIKTLYNSTKSLSMADNSHSLLLEYSEEVPIMMSNFGMANRIINYYRRKNMEDNARPKAEIGETAVLLPQDKSPFSIFGHIDPGETTIAISNAMYRAPLFHHQAKPTDFLVIRNSTVTGGSDYYIRNIDHLYVVGQEFPSTDVPGPHSRKVTTTAKNRLKMLTFRLLKKSGEGKLSISDITAHFPGSTDMQNRQKMKEFVHHDKDSKLWVPKEPIPDSDTIRSWIQPEDVCLLESMQVGQQHLHDSGYADDAIKGGDDDEDVEGESLEQQMAPWKTTRNFLLASQGKAMLKLHGEGDPTGRGEGFSFIKTSMKGGFKPIGESVEDKLDAQRLKELGGHSYNVARQQKSYETSIRRIWEAQKASLSSTVEPSDVESDIDDEEDEFDKPTPRPGRRDDESVSQFSSKTTGTSQRGKVLRIIREYKNEKGELYQQEQLVWDPRVIKQYTQYRYNLEAMSTKLDQIEPTGDPEIDARNKKLLETELNRLNRNKERRFAREKQKGAARASTGESPDGGTPGAGKTGGTQRKCANCGQVGHIKTNKKCAKYVPPQKE
ncbi:transcription factor TFIID complex 145 kDa subunit [Thermoascus aurantiacus ATCC 26904]